jgi:hypothetical protein
MKGQIKKTKDAGVTKVGNRAANAAFVVEPTGRLRTDASVGTMGGDVFIMEAILMRPKYPSDAKAGM